MELLLVAVFVDKNSCILQFYNYEANTFVHIALQGFMNSNVPRACCAGSIFLMRYRYLKTQAGYMPGAYE